METYVNDDAKARAEQAREFLNSSASSSYVSQNLENERDDLCEALHLGVSKLKDGLSEQIIGDLTETAKGSV